MTRYWVAVAAVCIGAAAGIGAAGCGSDDSGDDSSITVPSIDTAIPSVTTTAPTDEGFPTNPDTTPDVYTTPTQTNQNQNQNQNQGNGNGGSSAEQNFNDYCKQYPGACGD